MSRQAVDVAVVVEGNDLFLEDAIQFGGVTGVGDAVIDVLGAAADGEAVGAVVGLGPPAVEDRQIRPR